jgi:hypothetical protein
MTKHAVIALYLTSCRSYADWKAHESGDMLDGQLATDLTLMKGLCAL